MKIGIYDEIEDLSAQLGQITQAQEDVDIYINSPGGAVLEGLNMVNAIKECPYTVTAHVNVLAASMAAVIALACDKVEVSKNAILMLHNCITVFIGNKEEMDNERKAMEAIDTVLHNIITEKCYDDTLGEKINEGEVWLTGENVAELFEHAELSEPVKQEKKVADGASSLANIIKAWNMANHEEKTLTDDDKGHFSASVDDDSIIITLPYIEPKEEPKEEYTVSDELKSLLEEAERIVGDSHA